MLESGIREEKNMNKNVTYHRSHEALPFCVVVSPNLQSRHCVAMGSFPSLAYPNGHGSQPLPYVPAPQA